MREVRGEGEAWARLSGQPLCKKWRGRRSGSCGGESGVPWDGPCRALEIQPALEMTRESSKPARLAVGLERLTCQSCWAKNSRRASFPLATEIRAAVEGMLDWSASPQALLADF